MGWAWQREGRLGCSPAHETPPTLTSRDPALSGPASRSAPSHFHPEPAGWPCVTWVTDQGGYRYGPGDRGLSPCRAGQTDTKAVRGLGRWGRHAGEGGFGRPLKDVSTGGPQTLPHPGPPRAWGSGPAWAEVALRPRADTGLTGHQDPLSAPRRAGPPGRGAHGGGGLGGDEGSGHLLPLPWKASL